jgi:hypothetical protein
MIATGRGSGLVIFVFGIGAIIATREGLAESFDLSGGVLTAATVFVTVILPLIAYGVFANWWDGDGEVEVAETAVESYVEESEVPTKTKRLEDDRAEKLKNRAEKLENELSTLKNLLDKELITQKEFDIKRKKIMLRF